MDGSHFTTGLSELDNVMRGILPGDNIVWRVDGIDDYRALVAPYCKAAATLGRPLVYFRFAGHPPLLDDASGAQVYAFDPDEGFETFTGNVHRIIKQTGRGAYYVFDCLTRLAISWHSDQMLGNFFMLTCPYLFDLETLTYFALYRGQHSNEALTPIRDTTQIFLDVYNKSDVIYVRPVKTQHRYSDTINMLHAWEGDAFTPVTASTLIAEILTAAKWSGLMSDRTPGFWDRAFIDATEASREARRGNADATEVQAHFDRLAPMVISRDPAILKLVREYLSLDDILNVRRRMIGTGLIGGKSVGMLLARGILKRADPKWRVLLEEHDSFFIGSDVFYTYLVRNGIWWHRESKELTDEYFESTTRARRLVITGTFSPEIRQQLEEMLDYFGQTPFIVRSSSLLEDNFGNAFAGKYDSVFCANRGPRAQRLEDLLAAIRTIYASSIGERALRYRAQRGLLDHDEQMAILVMRVSGAMRDRCFYPAAAGVGFSFNPFAWHPDIDPAAGVLRLVFGLGTRAVDRSDDDYTRLIAINAPERRPEHSFEAVRQRAQRRVDYLDLDANHLVSGHFLDLAPHTADLPMSLFVSHDRTTKDRDGKPVPVLTFDGLIAKTNFVRDMHDMMMALESAYQHPVDIEYTVNFVGKEDYRINLVQCRPLQVGGTGVATLPDIEVPREDVIIEANSAIIGQSRLTPIDRFIYITPEAYSATSASGPFSQ